MQRAVNQVELQFVNFGYGNHRNVRRCVVLMQLNFFLVQMLHFFLLFLSSASQVIMTVAIIFVFFEADSPMAIHSLDYFFVSRV